MSLSKRIMRKYNIGPYRWRQPQWERRINGLRLWWYRLIGLPPPLTRTERERIVFRNALAEERGMVSQLRDYVRLYLPINATYREVDKATADILARRGIKPVVWDIDEINARYWSDFR